MHNLRTTTKILASRHSLLGLGLNFCLWCLGTADKSSVDLTQFYVMFTPECSLHTPRCLHHHFFALLGNHLLIKYLQNSSHVFLHYRLMRCFTGGNAHLPTFYLFKDSSSPIVFKSNKNLGPIILEHAEFITQALNEHLLTDT